ncbi:1,4-alpha-glucan branching protein GlgB [Chitinasiproducens palmae]|uniref:1,4-alpha-glucan branching enzyme GlgB n=1 Tax=Chitinasiproducens palmae TaxID=1770053 RepID=A0A1H2PNB3_9BURK|nr:1,4-alpha-glucan branching protein GlgB [Chitinasiproducens palmae]SDV47653.1 1,4-alpha-glucan branching enzyme [Chitinasiproducens palmae]
MPDTTNKAGAQPAGRAALLSALDASFSRDEIDALLHARHDNPFRVLGAHRLDDGRRVVRALLPGARSVQVVARDDGRPLGTLTHHADDGRYGLFTGEVASDAPYLLRIDWEGTTQETEDPYTFGALLPDDVLHQLSNGDAAVVNEALGSRAMTVDGVAGVRFAVWAPNASRVSVVGDFNSWDGRRHPMRKRHYGGVWEIFVPRLGPGTRYKYEIAGRDGGVLPLKADPLARQTEKPPATASIVADPTPFTWHDDAWLAVRSERQRSGAPISIYEVHAESWMRIEEDGWRTLNWEELGERLIPYVKSLGFTHLEFLPIAEHPFGGSWGYQPLGQFAPSARFGTPQQFAAFVDRCHAESLGVILDWVPAHFPNDAHGLIQFDGTPLYEHADPREGYHQDWNTMIYNLGRNEVGGFLAASALNWLEHFHVDGLRVDAVASMLYRDYSRKAGEWVPNVYGGRENLESIAFLRRLNDDVKRRCPGTITIAEESTAWPGVTAPVDQGGLGFDFKWNMGWMHDTLDYMSRDPLYRSHHHHEMTFSMVYAYSERFVLPLSHDEVVHGKGSLLGKMPGDRWQRFANLRAYLSFMWTHPGKKLLFMGGELGQLAEWNHDQSPHWHLLEDALHAGMQRLVGDLNRLYTSEPALYERDDDPSGFGWLIGDDAANSVFAFRRIAAGRELVVVVNLTPVLREGYRVGLPRDGHWQEVFNSDASIYGGSNRGNGGGLHAEHDGRHGQPFSAAVTLPPLGCVMFSSVDPGHAR